MIWAYEGVSIEDLRKIDLIGERSERLFNDYIDRMFNPINRTKLNRRYQEKKTKFRLTWLAQNMLRESQTIFLIEEMQPSWLQSKAEKNLFSWKRTNCWTAWFFNRTGSYSTTAYR